MKRIFLIILLLLPIMISAQNYKLVNAKSKKLFTDNNPNPFGYSLSIDSAFATGPDSLYLNFFNVSKDLTPTDTCFFWGNPDCYKQDVPSWIGRKIIYNNQYLYSFITLNNDTLSFDFSTNTTDTSIIFRDSMQIFSLAFDGSDTIDLNGITDSVRFFRIIHTDTSYNNINSVLDNYRIIIAKNLGLIQLFQIDSFPQLLRPLKLIGDKNGQTGFYSLTNEKIFDHQVGDEIQWHESYFRYIGPPSENYNRFRKYFYLNKVVSADSIIYKVKQEIFNNNAALLTIDTIYLRYARKDVYHDIPFEKFDGNIRMLKLTDYCDTSFWAYTLTSSNDLGYCAADNCWGNFDTQGPPPHTGTVIVTGLGVYANYSNIIDPNGWSLNTEITYFKKAENSCGLEYFASINENLQPNTEISIFPNPANSELVLKSSSDIKRIEIFDCSGKCIVRRDLDCKECRIIISNLNNGIYYLRTINSDNFTSFQKFVVMKPN